MGQKRTLCLQYTPDNERMKIVDSISKQIRGVGKPVIVSKMIDKVCSDPDLLFSVICELTDKGEAQVIYKSIVKQFKLRNSFTSARKVQSAPSNSEVYDDESDIEEEVKAQKVRVDAKKTNGNNKFKEAEDDCRVEETAPIKAKSKDVEATFNPEGASDIFKSSGTKIARKGSK